MRLSGSPLRITVLLAALGALFGALAGMLVGITLTSLDGVSHVAFDPALLELGATVGAPMGTLLFPLAGWALMRQVPLGRALVGAVLGTLAGAIIGWVWPPVADRVTDLMVGAVGGFGVAVLILRRLATRSRARAAKDLQGAA
jgi:hypothetical protein